MGVLIILSVVVQNMTQPITIAKNKLGNIVYWWIIIIQS